MATEYYFCLFIHTCKTNVFINQKYKDRYLPYETMIFEGDSMFSVKDKVTSAFKI